MFLSNRGSFRPETSGAYTLRRRGRRRPKSGSAIGACAVARLAGSGGPIGDYYGSANTDRKVRAAGFPFVKTLADFDFSFQPSIPRAVVDDLATLRFLDAAENVVLVGSPGVGKTHIAVALGVEAVRARKEVRFTDCAALVRDLKDASSRGILAKRLKYYAHATLLIIDELGYLDVDEEGADLLFQLVSARYEHRSTVITTNVAVGLWADVFGDAVTAAAIADRVCHHCTMLKITGRSYRMKDLLAEAADGDGLPERGQS